MGGNSPRTLKSGVSTPALTDFLLQSQPQEPEIPTIRALRVRQAEPSGAGGQDWSTR